ncbi:MAG: T9SS type A sorting domain-containing protein [Bacteroidales bacterium]|nr:T9SS type A sorting domain-containing protein [Bacteroidales bacterium]
MKNKNLRFRLLAILGGVFMLLLATSTTWAQTGAVNVGQETSDPGTAAIEYLAGMRIDPATGNINPQDLQNAQQGVAALLQTRAKSDFNWETRGPINKSGRISSFLFDAKDETGATIYAASPSGGIWKTTNGGLTYSAAGEENKEMKSSKLYQAENGDLFVCTGEPADALRFNGYGNFQGSGIYKSSDGNTFTQLSGTVPQGEDSPWYCVFNFTIADGKYYAATIQGLYVSADNGESWVLAKDKENNEMAGICTNVATTTNGELIAALNSHFYFSTTGQNGFTNHSIMYHNEIDSVINPEKLPRDGIAYLTFAIAPSDPATIYAVTCNVDDPISGTDDEYGTLEGVYVTFDGAENWEKVGPGSSTGFNVYSTNNGPYTDALAIHPDNNEHIIIGGTNIFEGHFVQHNTYYQWTEKTSSNSGILYIPANKHEIRFHPNNTNIIAMATDAGIYTFNLQTYEIIGLNKGLGTTNCYSVNAGYDGSLISSTQSNNSLIMSGQGTLPNYGINLQFPLYTSSFTGGRSYHSFIYPISMFYTNDGVASIDYIRADDEAPQTVHLDGITDNDKTFMVPSVFWESFTNENSRDSIEFKAESFTAAGTTVTLESKNGKYPVEFTLPYDLPQGNDSTIMVQDKTSSKFFIALKDNIYMTTGMVNFFEDPEWFLIANTTNSGFEGTSTCVAVTPNANHLFVGTAEGKLYRISNLALAYNAERADVTNPTCIVSTALIASFDDRVVTSIAADPNDENHIIVTLGNYGYEDYVLQCDNTLDEFPEFTTIQGNLPKMPVYTAMIEMNNRNHVIIGTDMGVYETTSTSNPSWVYASQGIGTIPVFEIKQQTLNHYPIVDNGKKKMVTNFGAIYAATGGKGVFESRAFVGIGDYEPENTTQVTNLSLYPNPVIDQAALQFDASQAGFAMINIFDLNGRILSTQNLQLIRQGSHTIEVDLNRIKQGTYILQLVVNGKSSTTKFMVVQ